MARGEAAPVASSWQLVVLRRTNQRQAAQMQEAEIPCGCYGLRTGAKLSVGTQKSLDFALAGSILAPGTCCRAVNYEKGRGDALTCPQEWYHLEC